MPYIVRVRGVEIVCESLDELDELVERYGSDSAEGGGASSRLRRSSGGPPGASASDVALLRAMAEGGAQGVSSEQIGHMLGTQGKGIPPALSRWAVRMGISTDGDAFDAARPGGARGWRLKSGVLAVAKGVLDAR